MTLAYVDSSVVLGDILEERPVLAEFTQRADVATSHITTVEIARTLRRDLKETDLSFISSQLLAGIDLLSPSAAVLEIAASLPARFLRALDAIHLASALLVQADVVLTRDRQMQRACEELGLVVA
ncbi:MAG TPA: type II toxin-antitoxin system VapC family toxin [Candidatus Nanopelagicales bacterium]|nr:type II toxin-antitoxin system VapC family toxin [Candidatus Nanopelagicales bacterium]